QGHRGGGRPTPPHRPFAGLNEPEVKHKNHPPFDLPKIWLDRNRELDLNTPFNFVSTADIIGGNSGSPVIDRKGELVGIIFDGNIQSLVADFIYTEEQGRAVAVHSRGILEALSKVYEANDLVEELIGKNGASRKD